MADLIEEQPAVKTFLESKSPTHEQIVKAYLARDEIFGNNLDESFNQAMIKLGLHPDYYEKEIDNRYRKVLLNTFDNFLKDKSNKIEFPDYFSFNENLVKTEYEKRNERFNTLFLLKDNMKNIYDKLSKDELLYLGW
mgnify:CR=1 FL=1